MNCNNCNQKAKNPFNQFERIKYSSNISSVPCNWRQNELLIIRTFTFCYCLNLIQVYWFFFSGFGGGGRGGFGGGGRGGRGGK